MVDPKVRNLTIFVVPRLVILSAAGYTVYAALGSEVWRTLVSNSPYLNLISVLVVILVVWRGCLSLVRRLVLPA